ncbi:protein of unknown function [Faunimonas pinastri]|uniref:DUF305 domain-containing protein n=1 Tax=Faunimonas pinastri TaxID=1855383 RepID=A0A1H9JY69_9HYPH|nr:DUF305 domain-containing protein [Faunimonas pinastri]SEQ91758.1 protein of unknown function [Faunimonas pinastri]
MKITTILSAFIATGALALPGMASAQGMQGMQQEAGKTQAAAASPADQAFARSMQKMMTNMKMNPTGHPDHDFATMMIPHHQGAIDMAEVELKYGKDPELRMLAGKIVASQKPEVAELKAWLAKHPK